LGTIEIDAAPARRMTRLREGMAERSLDAFLATSRPAIAYLTGFDADAFERLVAAVIRPERSLLVLPALEREAAAEHAVAVELEVWEDGADPLALLVGLLREPAAGAMRLGVEETSLSFEQADRLRRELPGLELEPAGSLVGELRLRKDEQEIAAMRTAADLLAEGLDRMFGQAAERMAEVELQGVLELELKRLGGRSVTTLVQIGERAALPHGASGSRELRRGDVLLVDATTTSGGYWADVTRCATLGPPSDEVASAWEVVRAAHAAGVAAVRPGARAAEIDAAARAAVEAGGHDAAFIHRTGHGLGLEVHEPPYLSSSSDEVLEPGMVVTVEPGVYFSGRFGLRLEDDVLVTETGSELLTDGPRDLIRL
jgi:Xaa-Pro dipeptidase